jgi:hypothetical protein
MKSDGAKYKTPWQMWTSAAHKIISFMEYFIYIGRRRKAGEGGKYRCVLI